MPSRKAAFKSLRADARKTQYNVNIKSELKTLAKKAEQAIADANADLEKIKKAYNSFISKLDKAVIKGIVPKKRASRKKSRLSKKINKR